MRRAFNILEPSKVGVQHLSFLESYLVTFENTQKLKKDFDITFIASPKTHDRLEKSRIPSIVFKSIYVVDPLERRLIFKNMVDTLKVVRQILAKKNGDILLVTCLLPTSLILVELINRLLRRQDVFVVLHGEIESLFDHSSQSFQRIGWWSRLWWRVRSDDSKIKLIVIDDFIKEQMDNIGSACTNVAVIHQPIIPEIFDVERRIDNRVCFIGFRTKHKGYNEFVALASKHKNVEFVAIGGEIVENIRSGSIDPLENHHDYLKEISKCHAAVFLYTDGYSATLSGAALDAIKVGVPILALRRPFFVSASDHLGDDVVTVYNDISQISNHLQQMKFSSDSTAQNHASVLASRYSVASISKALDLFFAVD
jgi:hypothetical protein